MASDPPFDPEGDTSFRTIEGTARASELAYDDSHYDHACVDRDLNCVFPLDRLHELSGADEIRGVTDHHYAFGFTMKLRQIRDETFPAIASAVDRHRPDIVVLTGG